MDYKEKYEMALERARVWKDKSGMPADKQGILDDIFPELAGSEDEQIRKELTKHLKEGVEGYMPAGDSSDYRRWLDWLEKQGETYTKKDVDNAYIEGMVCAKNELEKQGEQKPTWSEEDEERLSDAIFFVREYQIPTRDKRLLNAAKEAEDWLKSLKERIGG